METATAPNVRTQGEGRDEAIKVHFVMHPTQFLKSSLQNISLSLRHAKTR